MRAWRLDGPRRVVGDVGRRNVEERSTVKRARLSRPAAKATNRHEGTEEPPYTRNEIRTTLN